MSAETYKHLIPRSDSYSGRSDSVGFCKKIALRHLLLNLSLINNVSIEVLKVRLFKKTHSLGTA